MILQPKASSVMMGPGVACVAPAAALHEIGSSTAFVEVEYRQRLKNGLRLAAHEGPQAGEEAEADPPFSSPRPWGLLSLLLRILTPDSDGYRRGEGD